MFDFRQPSPLLFVADCSKPPPAEVAQDFLPREILKQAKEIDTLSANALLWSRLIIKTSPLDSCYPALNQLKIEDDLSGNITFHGDSYKYAKIEARGGWVAVALSSLPIYLSFMTFDASEETKELTRLRFSVIFNDWIDRQENPELAFYHLWALTECLSRRKDPTVRVLIGDDDLLTVRGSSVMLRETFQFWTSAYWICAVQGPSLSTLLTDVRSPEKTLELLKQQKHVAQR